VTSKQVSNAILGQGQTPTKPGNAKAQGIVERIERGMPMLESLQRDTQNS
jgi:hypothetical protein